MKLCHNDQWSCLHLWHDLWPRRCHIEVTRVKKVNLAKSLLLQLKWYCHVIHAYGSLNLSLFRLYKKKISKVIWDHKVKQRSNFNNVKWQNKRCQHVGLGQTCKSLHGDLSLRPTVQGSKVKKVKYQTTSNGKTSGANMLAWSTKVKF